MDDFRVLILDDEVDILESLSNILGASGYEVDTYRTAKDFLNERAWKNPGSGAALVDLSLAGASGIDVLMKMSEEKPDFPTAVISGTGEIRAAVQALQSGAREFFEKPLEATSILAWLASIRSMAVMETEHHQLLADTLARYELVGSSPAMSAVRATIVEYAPLAETVLICGETGTGKELAAAQLHYLSPRRSRPFRAVNIAALASELIDSQLFGHLKGSFSGAIDNNQGLVLASKKSTLFLDEIGELKMESQAKLLRVLQDHEVLSLGSTRPEKVDVRFVCATNRELPAEAELGHFRKDLYYRIAGLTIVMPPLRERVSDIPELAECFLFRFSREYNLPRRMLGKAALDKLLAYAFPGNVRELQSVILRAIMESKNQPGDCIAADAILFGSIRSNDIQTPGDDLFRSPGELVSVRHSLEKRYIEVQLALHDYSVPVTAGTLGLTPSNLYRRMRALGISQGNC